MMIDHRRSGNLYPRVIASAFSSAILFVSAQWYAILFYAPGMKWAYTLIHIVTMGSPNVLLQEASILLQHRDQAVQLGYSP